MGNLESENSRAALLKLKIGMTSDEVIIVMGSPPYRTESFTGKAGEQILTYMYLTRMPVPRKSDEKFAGWADVREDDLTPLVFSSNRLDGWGWSYLETASKRYEFVIKVRDR